jgi:malonyl-CoA decarboxylase
MFVADTQRQAEAQVLIAAGWSARPTGAEVCITAALTVPPRRRLLQRFSVYPQASGFGRSARHMPPFLKGRQGLMALDVELEYMFSNWFDVGFLDFTYRRDLPASLD